jgi:hypothetical protein
MESTEPIADPGASNKIRVSMQTNNSKQRAIKPKCATQSGSAQCLSVENAGKILGLLGDLGGLSPRAQRLEKKC